MRAVLVWIATAGFALASAGCAGSPKTQAAAAAHSAGPMMTITPPDGNDRDRFLEAIELMDAGNLDGSIGILETLRSRYPNSALVLHELALAHRLAKRPGKAVDLLTPLKERLPPRRHLHHTAHVPEMVVAGPRGLHRGRQHQHLLPFAITRHRSQGAKEAFLPRPRFLRGAGTKTQAEAQ